ncbi:MAG TPA: HlyD family secretion protein [Candidatus Sulfotelmatobacter sp.]|jgi:membrane fusion protein (multidrug efflux system)|nr:HlyD family secretion protein [Candidatus Sulfotelmatobacter sp.]
MSVEIDVGLENAANVKVPHSETRKLDLQSEALVSSNLRLRLIAGGVILLAALLGLYLYFHNRENTDDAQVDGHITPIAAKIYGRVAKVQVNDNQAVKAGQVLVQLDAADYQAALDQAKGALALAEGEARSAGVDVPRTSEDTASGTSSAQAQLAGAQADLMRAQATYEQSQTADLAFAQANIAKSRANAQLAQADLARYLPLMEKGEISKQQYDAAKANADATASALNADEQKLVQAQRNVEISSAQLEAAKARVLQAQAGVASAHADIKRVAMRSADAQAKLAKVDQARAQVEAAQLNLGYCSVVAPINGVVTHKQVEDGQIVQQGQGLMVIVPLQDVWVTANFKETQLRKMRAGQKAYVEVDTYGKTFTGHVDSIAGATGAVVSLLPPENATGNFVKVVQRIPVKIVLDPIPSGEAVLRPGMNVDATVITK